jgi:hypothetical protein
MTHACNPSYSGGRDQEDCGSEPAWANSSQDPISKNPSLKKKKKWAGGVAQGEGPEFKPQYRKKKKKKRFTLILAYVSASFLFLAE